MSDVEDIEYEAARAVCDDDSDYDSPAPSSASSTPSADDKDRHLESVGEGNPEPPREAPDEVRTSGCVDDGRSTPKQSEQVARDISNETKSAAVLPPTAGPAEHNDDSFADDDSEPPGRDRSGDSPHDSGVHHGLLAYSADEGTIVNAAEGAASSTRALATPGPESGAAAAVLTASPAPAATVSPERFQGDAVAAAMEARRSLMTSTPPAQPMAVQSPPASAPGRSPSRDVEPTDSPCRGQASSSPPPNKSAGPAAPEQSPECAVAAAMAARRASMIAERARGSRSPEAEVQRVVHPQPGCRGQDPIAGGSRQGLRQGLEEFSGSSIVVVSNGTAGKTTADPPTPLSAVPGPPAVVAGPSRADPPLQHQQYPHHDQHQRQQYPHQGGSDASKSPQRQQPAGPPPPYRAAPPPYPGAAAAPPSVAAVPVAGAPVARGGDANLAVFDQFCATNGVTQRGVSPRSSPAPAPLQALPLSQPTLQAPRSAHHDPCRSPDPLPFRPPGAAAAEFHGTVSEASEGSSASLGQSQLHGLRIGQQASVAVSSTPPTGKKGIDGLVIGGDAPPAQRPDTVSTHLSTARQDKGKKHQQPSSEPQYQPGGVKYREQQAQAAAALEPRLKEEDLMTDSKLFGLRINKSPTPPTTSSHAAGRHNAEAAFDTLFNGGGPGGTASPPPAIGQRNASGAAHRHVTSTPPSELQRHSPAPPPPYNAVARPSVPKSGADVLATFGLGSGVATAPPTQQSGGTSGGWGKVVTPAETEPLRPAAQSTAMFTVSSSETAVSTPASTVSAPQHGAAARAYPPRQPDPYARTPPSVSFDVQSIETETRLQQQGEFLRRHQAATPPAQGLATSPAPPAQGTAKPLSLTDLLSKAHAPKLQRTPSGATPGSVAGSGGREPPLTKKQQRRQEQARRKEQEDANHQRRLQQMQEHKERQQQRHQETAGRGRGGGALPQPQSQSDREHVLAFAARNNAATAPAIQQLQQQLQQRSPAGHAPGLVTSSPTAAFDSGAAMGGGQGSQGGQVSVYWDYDNIPIASNGKVNTLVSSIKQFFVETSMVRSTGDVFLEAFVTANSGVSNTQHAALQEFGVKTVTCSSRKEGADATIRMSLNDEFARGCPGSRAFALITSDKLLAAEVKSIVRSHRARLVLLHDAPKSTSHARTLEELGEGGGAGGGCDVFHIRNAMPHAPFQREGGRR